MAHGDKADASGFEDIHGSHEGSTHDAEDVRDAVGGQSFNERFAGGHSSHWISLPKYAGIMLAGVLFGVRIIGYSATEGLLRRHKGNQGCQQLPGT